jgi:hypothetical protein
VGLDSEKRQPTADEKRSTSIFTVLSLSIYLKSGYVRKAPHMCQFSAVRIRPAIGRRPTTADRSSRWCRSAVVRSSISVLDRFGRSLIDHRLVAPEHGERYKAEHSCRERRTEEEQGGRGTKHRTRVGPAHPSIPGGRSTASDTANAGAYREPAHQIYTPKAV